MGFLDKLKGRFAAKQDVLERFELVRSAISGTMSNFYMARERSTQKIVGLKLLDIQKTALVEGRFKGLSKPSEGEIAMSIRHPLVVTTYEHGVAANGQTYIVMEFLDGPGLNSLVISQSPLLNGNRLTLLRQAAEALSAVHAAGYIHRDVCPRNFVTSKDASSLKLIDFGLTVPNTPTFTQPGNRTGTPNYMAPEVVRRRKTGITLDVFSFGVTAYEIFAFELPWQRGSTGKAAMSHDSPPTDIRQYCPNIHPHLAQAITACLAARPEDRPQSMKAFLKLIENVDSETVTPKAKA